MKKLLAGILSFVLVFSLSACGNKAEKEETKQETKVQTEAPVEKAEEKPFADWEEFLAEYNAWVDEYIVLLKKYKENPTDEAIKAEQQSKLSELTDWANRTGEVQKELENASPEVLKKYQEEVSKILLKITEAMK